MGLFRFTHDKLEAGSDGKVPIFVKCLAEDASPKTRSKGIDYAWKVYNSPKRKYTTQHRENALLLLLTIYKIPEDRSESDRIALVSALIEEKNKRNAGKWGSYDIPTLSDLTSVVPRSALTSAVPRPALTSALPRSDLTAVVQRPAPNPAVRMQRIKRIDASARFHKKEEFLREVNDDIETLNRLIDQYNGGLTTEIRIATIKEIYQLKLQIESTYSDIQIKHCPQFGTEIHEKLFKEIQQQFESLGISMHNASQATPNTASSSRPTFPEILANMSPEKVSQLLEILLLPISAQELARKLNLLYTDSNKEAEAFRNFFADHSLSFLGGRNSRNFIIRPVGLVLKVENRMGMPKGADAQLRANSQAATFTPVLAERQTICNSTSGLVVRTILVSVCCAGGDLQTHGNPQPAPHTPSRSTEERLSSALHIYGQMGTILERIRKDGCAFPDMKNSNWLLDETGTVRIADTKAFVFTDKHGNIDYSHDKNRWYSLVSTLFMNPPEVSHRSFSADKMHSYMLGKNLYQYLSKCTSEHLFQRHNGQYYDFSDPIFSTDQGRELKMLIRDLVKPNPAARIPIATALFRLDRIKICAEIKECEAVLAALRLLDTRVDSQFLEDRKAEIKRAKNLPEIRIIQDKMVKEFKNICSNHLRTLAELSGEQSLIAAVKLGIGTEPHKDMEKIFNVMTDKENELATSAKNDCLQLLTQIGSHGLGEKDTKMNEFIREKNQDIKLARSFTEICEIKKNLSTLLTQVQGDPVVKEIKTIIQSYRERAKDTFSIGMRKKANRIEQAMGNVPITERKHILQRKTPEAQEVQLALAVRRYGLRKGDNDVLTNGVVDENKAAPTFRNFKKKVAALSNQERDVPEPKKKAPRAPAGPR